MQTRYHVSAALTDTGEQHRIVILSSVMPKWVEWALGSIRSLGFGEEELAQARYGSFATLKAVIKKSRHPMVSIDCTVTRTHATFIICSDINPPEHPEYREIGDTAQTEDLALVVPTKVRINATLTIEKTNPEPSQNADHDETRTSCADDSTLMHSRITARS